VADANEALRVTGLNLRSLFDRLPFAVQVFSADGRLHYVNPALRTLRGFDEAWSPPSDYNAFENPHLESLGFLSSVRRAFAGETVTLPPMRYSVEEMLALPEGRARWVQILIYPVKDEAGEARAVVVMHIDITEREEAQQLLEERVTERTHEIATLLKVSQSVALTLDFGALLGLILEQLKMVADYSGSTVVVVEDDHFRILDDRGGVTPDQSNLELIGTTWPVTQQSAIWETITRHEPVIIDDVSDDSELARAFREVTRRFEETPAISHVRSWLGVPLAIKDRVIGFIGISKDQIGYYTPHHARLAMAIATHAAAAIENARLYEEQRRATEELSTLLAISRNVSSTLELEPLLGLILDQLKPVVEYTSATVATRDDERYVMREYRGPLPREVVLSRPLPAGPLAEATAAAPEDAPFIIPDVWAETPMARAWRAVRGEEYLRTTASYLRCMLIAPLIHKGQEVGALTLTHQVPGFFTDHHAALAQAVADQVAGAVENARSFEHERSTARELAALLEVSRNMSSTLELQPLLVLILDQLKLIVDYTSAVLVMREGDHLIRREYRGPLPREVVTGRPLPLDRGHDLWEMIERDQVVIIPEVWADTAEARAFREMLGEEYLRTTADYIQCVLEVPLRQKGVVVGTLTLTHQTSGYFTEHHAMLARVVADQAAVAIENAELFERTQKLAALEERQRIARELHDSVSQVLFSINLAARTVHTLLERGDQTRATSSVEYVSNLAEMGMAEMRALLFELRPESLEQEGLVAAIGKQAAALRARHSVQVDISLSGEPEVSLDVKEALYRIAQEAMHNTVKHARATQIGVHLRDDPAGVALEVQDNGLGFDPSGDFPGHLGLRSMRERVGRLGGTLDILSAPGQGTTVRATVPV